MSTEQEIIKHEEEYSASNIQVLEGLEAVRKRPAMYIGDIGEKGLHHLVYEVVDNSIDEALAGYCTHIDVTINKDNSITVRDNGRGIPTDYHEKEGKSALEVVLTVLHAGGKFDKGSYKVSGGLHGVGVSCVNALSTLLVAEIHRGGKIYRQTYSKGVPTSKMEILGETEDRGTIITFLPDNSIFTLTTEYKYDTLANRLRELAFLNKGIHLSLTDLRQEDEQGEPKHEAFYSKDGLQEFVKYLDATRGEALTEDVIYIEDSRYTLSSSFAVEVKVKTAFPTGTSRLSVISWFNGNFRIHSQIKDAAFNLQGSSGWNPNTVENNDDEFHVYRYECTVADGVSKCSLFFDGNFVGAYEMNANNRETPQVRLVTRGGDGGEEMTAEFEYIKFTELK
jgi:DNA gyrase/topoisomerase IV subunit B